VVSSENEIKTDTEQRKAYARLPDGTTFLTNGESSLGVLGAGDYGYTDEVGNQISDKELIALLFDDMTTLTKNKEELQSEMMALAESKLDITTDGWTKEFRYLDLVNANDGNIVMNADKPVTIYWPYPTGITAADANNYDFMILHYKGMNREETIDSGVSLEDAKIAVERIDVTATSYGLKFEINSFSPFVLLWKTNKSENPDPNQPGGDNTVEEEENVDQVNNPDTEEPTEEDEYLDDSTVENVNSDNTEDTNDITEEDEVDKTESTFPGTGDTADVVRWILIMLICTAGAIVLIKIAVSKGHKKTL
jgi:hypothetical protein